MCTEPYLIVSAWFHWWISVRIKFKDLFEFSLWLKSSKITRRTFHQNRRSKGLIWTWKVMKTAIELQICLPNRVFESIYQNILAAVFWISGIGRRTRKLWIGHTLRNTKNCKLKIFNSTVHSMTKTLPCTVVTIECKLQTRVKMDLFASFNEMKNFSSNFWWFWMRFWLKKFGMRLWLKMFRVRLWLRRIKKI